tara:strand:- start:1414 stop:2598 length:1185 start_codon:yes stop_codon:yes gene_type:complete
MQETNGIYLDAASTTPPSREVIDLIFNIQENNWANPSNIYKSGIRSAELLERSRIRIAELLEAQPEDIIFTSGATESINLAILSTAMAIRPSQIVLSSVEHPAVISVSKVLRRIGWKVLFWPVDRYGNLKIECLDQFLQPPTRIVSLIWGQSEIGTLQPIELISKECIKREIIMHTDASQYISHAPISWKRLSVDYLSASAHKFRGPRGTGLLLKKSKRELPFFPIFAGGKQEQGYRGGTPSVDLIAGMSLALELIYSNFNSKDRDSNSNKKSVRTMTNDLRKELSLIENVYFTGDPYNRLSNHISMLVSNRLKKPVLTSTLIKALSFKGIYVSSGTACSTLSNSPSHVLKAINVDPKYYHSALRLTLGNWITPNDTLNIATVIQETIDEIGND